MSFKDFPQVKKQAKPPTALTGMSKEHAATLFSEKTALKKHLIKQLKKCERDITKYYLTMTKDK